MIPFTVRCKSRDLLRTIAEAQLYLRSGSVLDQLCTIVGPDWAVVVGDDGTCEVVPNDRNAPLLLRARSSASACWAEEDGAVEVEWQGEAT